MYREFQISIDVYLESCAEDGVAPLPPLPYSPQDTLSGETEPLPDPQVARP